MHTIAEVGTNVPAFLVKLWKMVQDPVTDDLISWSPNGTSFTIKDEIRFARDLLPMYYKHNNMASFIRQLNMYGFHKIVLPEAGTMKLDGPPDEIQFSHPCFIRGNSYLLDSIKRKMAGNKVGTSQLGEKASTQLLGKVLTDVKQMKSRQESIDSRLSAMKLENGALWRELSLLRQKHVKQQQMVNKLIQFLVTLVHQNPSMFSMKRKYPRMLTKARNHSHNVAEDASPVGPVIHELDPAEVLLGSVVEDEQADPSEVDDYIIDQSNEVVEDGIVEMPSSVSENHSPTTVTSLPDDILVINKNNSKQQHSKNKSTNIIYLPEEINRHKQGQMLRPNYNIRIVAKNSNNDIEIQKQIQQTQQLLMKKQEQNKQDLQKEIKLNQQQIQRNIIQIDRSEELKKNQQRLLKSQQERIEGNKEDVKLHQELINNRQQMFSNSHNETVNNKNLLQKNQQLLLGSLTQLKRPQQKKQQPILQIKQPKVRKTLFEQRQLELLQRAQINKNFVKEETLISESDQEQELQTSVKCTQIQRNTQPQEIQTNPIHHQQQFQIDLTEEQQDDQQNVVVDGVQPDSGPMIYVNGKTIGTSGVEETILGLVEGPGSPSEFQMSPIVVEVPPPSTGQKSPPDLLLGSPLVMADPMLGSPSTSSTNMQVACLDEAASSNMITRSANLSSEMGNHVDAMQTDLDTLKELLRTEGISLDANTLLGCFSEDVGPMSYNILDPVSQEDPNRPRENNGNELIMYNAPPLDLSDLMEWSLPSSPIDAPTDDDSFAEIHTPQFVLNSPTYPFTAALQGNNGGKADTVPSGEHVPRN